MPKDFSAAVLQEVPEAVRIVPQEEAQNQATEVSKQVSTSTSSHSADSPPSTKSNNRKSLHCKSWSTVPDFADEILLNRRNSSPSDEGKTQKQQILEELHVSIKHLFFCPATDLFSGSLCNIYCVKLPSQK